MREIVPVLALFALLWPVAAAAEDYAETRREIEEWRKELAAKHGFDEGDGELDAGAAEQIEEQLVEKIDRLFGPWMGTDWAMGTPQTSTPGDGQINCSMFVGTVLVHAGFETNHVKLHRQPSALIAETLAPPSKIRRFRFTPVDEFLEEVRDMGSGLYILGLDNHVGFLRVEKDGTVRFVHASYVPPQEVVDEPARESKPVVSSDLRVVGKILQRDLLESWLAGERIPVKGDW